MNKTTRSIAFILIMTVVFLLLGCAAVAPEGEAETPLPTAYAPEAETPLPTAHIPEAEASPDPEQGSQEEKERAFQRSDFPAFQTTDIDGNSLDNAVFSEAKVTMVNLWATWCGPCVYELPELEQLSQDYAEQVRVIGVYDYASADDEVRTLMEAEGLSYTMARYADAFYSLETGYVPTTYFVDGEGRIMGPAFVGARDYEGWSKVIDALLKDVD
ncbi:MAG: TlpA family protein disulfide reductase [Christensenellales bacterium]|jgi:thiol-disulfide isomerase/thioredoxin